MPQSNKEMPTFSQCNNPSCRQYGRQSEEAMKTLQEILPTASAKYVVCSAATVQDMKGTVEAEIRVDVTNVDELHKWKTDFQEQSLTTWRVQRTRKTNGKKIQHHVEFRCQHNTLPRSLTANDRAGSKNMDCPARMQIQIFNDLPVTQEQIKRGKRVDPHLPDHPTSISLRYTHNHGVAVADSLKHRDVSEATQQRLEDLLRSGYRPAAALDYLKYDLQMEDPENYILNSMDRSKCPDKQYVYRLYNKLFPKEPGSRKSDADKSAPKPKKEKNANSKSEVTLNQLKQISEKIEKINENARREVNGGEQGQGVNIVPNPLNHPMPPNLPIPPNPPIPPNLPIPANLPIPPNSAIPPNPAALPMDPRGYPMAFHHNSFAHMAPTGGYVNDAGCSTAAYLAPVTDVVRMKVIDNKQMAIAVCTPLMRRVHRLVAESGELVFCDASGNLDRSQSRVFVLLTHCAVGALPLGILIVSTESCATISAALQLLHEMVGMEAFYGRGPRGPMVIMTDDSKGERQALQNTYRSTLLLCTFHILQTYWRYLWDSKQGIHKSNRQHLFSLMKNMLYAATELDLQRAFEAAMTDPVVLQHEAVHKYLKDMFERRKEWAVCCRTDLPMRTYTISYSEAAMRVLKDQILHRTKAFNVQQLIDFILVRLESYYQKRCSDAAKNRLQNRQKSKQQQLKSSEQVAEIRQVGPTCFEVVSGKDGQKVYSVNMETGFCTCAVGRTGGPCKHQTAISHRYQMVDSSNYFPGDQASRQLFHQVATGASIEAAWLATLADGSAASSDSEADDHFDDNSDGPDDAAADDRQKTTPASSAGESQSLSEQQSLALAELRVMFEDISSKVMSDQTLSEGAIEMVKTFKTLKTNIRLNAAMTWFGKYSSLSPKKKRGLDSNKDSDEQPSVKQSCVSPGSANSVNISLQAKMQQKAKQKCVSNTSSRSVNISARPNAKQSRLPVSAPRFINITVKPDGKQSRVSISPASSVKTGVKPNAKQSRVSISSASSGAIGHRNPKQKRASSGSRRSVNTNIQPNAKQICVSTSSANSVKTGLKPKAKQSRASTSPASSVTTDQQNAKQNRLSVSSAVSVNTNIKPSEKQNLVPTCSASSLNINMQPNALTIGGQTNASCVPTCTASSMNFGGQPNASCIPISSASPLNISGQPNASCMPTSSASSLNMNLQSNPICMPSSSASPLNIGGQPNASCALAGSSSSMNMNLQPNVNHVPSGCTGSVNMGMQPNASHVLSDFRSSVNMGAQPIAKQSHVLGGCTSSLW